MDNDQSGEDNNLNSNNTGEKEEEEEEEFEVEHKIDLSRIGVHIVEGEINEWDQTYSEQVLTQKEDTNIYVRFK